jgi:ferric-dicitrate binding protein FerR (iron transport regulator)
MTTDTTDTPPAGHPVVLSLHAGLGLVERLRQRTLPEHGGRAADCLAHHWNLTLGDSELHAEARAEIERLRAELLKAAAAFEREQERTDAAEIRAETAQAAERERCAELCEFWDATSPKRLAVEIRRGA